MRKIWMLVSSIAVSAANVLVQTAYEAVNNSNTSRTATQHTSSAKGSSTWSGGMNNNGTSKSIEIKCQEDIEF